MKLEVIKSKEQHARYMSEIRRLVALDPEPESEEGKRLELLATLIEKYEQERFPFEKPDPIEAIKIRMEDLGLKQRDLVQYIGSPSKVSEVLSGKRALSLPMIRSLSKGLDIPTDVLIQETQNTGGLTPQAPQLDEAKKILEKLEKDIELAIWYASFYERVTLEEEADDICEAFGESYEAWGIEISQHALLGALIMAVCRITWGEEDDTASLQSLCKVLKKQEIVGVLPENDRAKVETLVNNVENDILGNHQCARVKKYRNTWLAHLKIDSGRIKPKGRKGAQWEDPVKVLNKLIPIVDEFLTVLAKDRSIEMPSRFESFRHETRRIADKFWKHAAHLGPVEVGPVKAN